MRPPCEAIVRFYLPHIRARVIKKLIEEYGWKASEVSKRLGISLPAVIKYKKLTKEEAHVVEESISEIVDKIAEMIVAGASDTDILLTLCESCLTYRMSNKFSELYRSTFFGRELPPHFCSRWVGLISDRIKERLEVLRDVDRALFTILSERRLVTLIPEVRLNIAMALREARGPEDIAAIPGRITVVGGRPYAMLGPEFGASKHLSKILLGIMEFFKDVRGVICIKFDERVERSMKRLGFKIVFVTRSTPSDEELVKAIHVKLVNLEEPPDAIIDRGCVGIEPITYIIGKSASDVVEKVIKIVDVLEE